MRLANAAVNKDGPRRSRFATPLCLIQLVFSAGFIILWCTSMPHSLLQQIHTDAESHLPSDYILAHHDEVVKDWKSAALCEQRPSLDHIKVMEKVLDPRAFLGELVKQKGQTWVQIGSNTMDSMNGNDPLKKMLGSIPTWNKVRERLFTWLPASLVAEFPTPHTSQIPRHPTLTAFRSTVLNSH